MKNGGGTILVLTFDFTFFVLPLIATGSIPRSRSKALHRQAGGRPDLKSSSTILFAPTS
jgi:hypothetical protein